MPSRQSVSLTFELNAILEALEGLRLLVYGLQELPADRHQVTVVAGALGGLAMVTTRLKAVVAAVRGDLNPAELLAAHNRVDDDGGQVDVLLRPWSPERAIEQAQQAAAFAQRQLRRGRR